MDNFLLLFFKLIPLYLIILLGFLAGKFLNAKKETVASLLIYIIAPVVVFSGVVKASLSLNNLLLPLIFFILCCLMCTFFLFIAKFIWNDSTKNILAFTAGSGNTGYFGLPVALAILGNNAFSLVTLILLGFILYENSLGFYVTAKGNYSPKDSLKRLLRLPSIYTFFLGIFINVLGINLGGIYEEAAASFISAYTILGMMLIGLGLAGFQKLKFDTKFISLSFLAKFIVWPVLVAALIILDKTFFHFYNNNLVYNVMILMSVVPLAANTVAFATVLKAQPEKASLAVFLSTIFALFFIPIVSALIF